MKARISRFVIAAAIAVLVALSGAMPVRAQSPSFPPNQGFNQSQLCPSDTCVITVNGGTLDDTGQIITPNWTPDVPVETTVLELTQDAASQRGSAWFNTPQQVTQEWTSVFQFRLSHSNPATIGPGDGFAFVIQNSGLSAIGGFGGGIGYGTRFYENPCCTPAGPDPGIPSSLAIEFDTFQNSWDLDGNHVAIQSCGVSPNSPNHNDSNCFIARASIPVNIADGSVHTARIVYKLPSCNGDCVPNLFVYIDGLGDPVLSAIVDIKAALGLDGTSAYVGFTAATRGASEAHDILNWTFSPNQSQAQQVTAGQTTTYNFQGGFANGGYDYTAQLNSGSVQVQVAPILMTQAACNALVQKNPAFAGTQCLVYHNADGFNNDFAVMFEITCPGLPNSECTKTDTTLSFAGELGSDYNFNLLSNPGFSKVNPYPGWLKGHGLDSTHPCTPNPDDTTPLFQSNQIDSFSIEGDPGGHTTGGSGGTGSCWLATYNTPNEAPNVTINTPANGASYAQGTVVDSNFTCSAVNQGQNSPVGPYLTVPAPQCTASVDGGPSFLTGVPIDTTNLGSHSFKATVLDSGSDTASTTYSYSVVSPTDLAILKVASPKAPVGSKLVYLIGVGNLGPSTAVNTVVTDVLPANTTFVSVSANKVNCSISGGKLSCSSSAIPCTSGGTVSCNVGSLMPLSWSSLNGATIKLTVQLGPALTAGKIVKNTATVSATNTDSQPGNNSSTASTLVTAH